MLVVPPSEFILHNIIQNTDIAIPLVMMRIRSARDDRWQYDATRAASPEVDIWKGALQRWEDIVQIV